MNVQPLPPPVPAIIVSGLPRSGTSLVMAMLAAGGIPAQTDGQRQADADNPNGYWELEAVKRLATDASWLASAAGWAVKIVVPLVRFLPADPRRHFQVLLLERDLDEVVASQAVMLERRGLQPALPPARLKPALARQWEDSRQLLAHRPNVNLRIVNHRQLQADPASTAAQLAEFLHLPLDIAAMAGVVDSALYRQRAGTPDPR
jgi:hypothetical protein